MPSRFTRRRFLAMSGEAGLAATLFSRLAGRTLASPSAGPLSPGERRTLRAAVARVIPAEFPGDWSAADVGADEYIVALLTHPRRIYAGGPTRKRFPRFRTLSRVKRIGWGREVRRLRGVYRRGLARLDEQAGGDFAAAPAPAQDAVLTELDDRRDPFFTALFGHVMEGTYAHPVYGGNRDFRAWKSFAYQGDVHGVRFPHIGPPDAPWNLFGGYAPEEMAQPGNGS